LNGPLTTFDLHLGATDSPAGLPNYYLVAMTQDRTLTVPVPVPSTLLIGRDPSADIRLEAGAVSREHARVHASGRAPAVSVEDLGSRNGTFVRGRQLAPRERAPLAVGDAIWVGGSALVLRQGLPPIVRPPPPGERVVIAPEMVALYEGLARLAPSRISVLVLGETGAGKEVVAESLHQMSGGPGRPFVRLNCAALPAELLESELFGSEKGAFTGAIAARPGLLETAEGGTLFLDEVGDLPLPLQGKLLRVLESGEFFRLGAPRPRQARVRFVAATNRDLKQAAAAGQFRPDLYYRLNGVSVVVPPLRARRAEILPLAHAFAQRIARGPDLAPVSFLQAACDRLVAYDWPGNIRELKSVVERSVLLSNDGRIDAPDLLFDALGAPAQALPTGGLAAGGTPGVTVPPGPAAPGPLSETDERARILATLESCAFNQKRAAELLGMPRRTLVYKMRRYALPRPRK
jgi:two-component system response regulator AtoC